jgi:hypothetical protein
MIRQKVADAFVIGLVADPFAGRIPPGILGMARVVGQKIRIAPRFQGRRGELERLLRAADDRLSIAR